MIEITLKDRRRHIACHVCLLESDSTRQPPITSEVLGANSGHDSACEQAEALAVLADLPFVGWMRLGGREERYLLATDLRANPAIDVLLSGGGQWVRRSSRLVE